MRNLPGEPAWRWSGILSAGLFVVGLLFAGCGDDDGPSDLDPTVDPIAYWRFDEGGGLTAADATGNGHAAALRTDGRAVSLDGISTYVAIPDATGLDGMTELTFDAWVYLLSYPPSYNHYAAILSKWGSGGASDDSYNLEIDWNGNWSLEVSDGLSTGPTISVRSASDLFPLNSWVHVTATWKSPGEIHLYMNGQEVSGDYYSGTGQNTSMVNDNTQEVWIGRSQHGELTYLHGIVDEVKIYDAVVAPGNAPPLPVANWTFDEGTGVTAADVSGQGHTGTLSSGAVWVEGRQRPAWVERANGHAVSLEGVCTYVAIPDATGLDGMTELTFDAWVYLLSYPPSYNHYAAILSKWGSGGASDDSYNLEIDWNGNWSLEVSDGLSTGPTISVRSASDLFPLNSWVHVTATWKSPGEIHLYMNGQEVSGDYYSGTGQNTSMVNDNTQEVWIGRSQHGELTYLHGIVDEVKIYDRRVSAE